jgi:DUF971 family protein
LRRHKDPKTLTIIFDGEVTFELPAEYPRVNSPNMEVQDHSAKRR